MAQFSVNPNRHDLYKQFKFRVDASRVGPE